MMTKHNILYLAYYRPRFLVTLLEETQLSCYCRRDAMRIVFRLIHNYSDDLMNDVITALN